MLMQPGAFVTSGGKPCVAGESADVHPHYIACPIATNYLRFLPMAGLSVDTAITKYYCAKIAPDSGRLARVLFRSQNAVANMVLGVHANENTTAVETVSAALSAGVTKEFVFSQYQHFAKGDKVHVSYNPNGAIPGDCVITIEWAYE